jgi:hypothetical protein
MANVLVGYSRKEGKTPSESDFPITFSVPYSGFEHELLSHTRKRWMKALAEYHGMSAEEMDEELDIDPNDVEFMIVPEDALNIVIMAESTAEFPGNDSAAYMMTHTLKLVVSCMSIGSTECTFV